MNKLKYFFTEFIPEVRGEWKKVTSPSRPEVIQTTLVVLVTSVIFALYLWGADKIIQWLYQGIFKLLGL